MTKPFFWMIWLAIGGCGLMAGLFFAFSVCVMRALGKLPVPQGIAAMQSINITIQNPLFFAVFFGTTALCLWACVFALRNANGPGARWLLAGSLCYLVGALLVTIFFNVPMNDALAAAKPTSPEAARVWANYLVVWTVWNHVRTAASLLAMGFLIFALLEQSKPQ